MGRRIAAAIAVAVSCSMAACGSGSDDGDDPVTRPVVGEIAPAVAALEAELGGPQQYFEINATVQFVNLFVARDDATVVQPYLYVDGELAPPAPSEPASGPTFAAAAMTFDADTILRGVSEDLPDSDIVVFSVNAGADDEPQYTASVQSRQGGVLDVTLSAEGETLAVDTLMPEPAGSVPPSHPTGPATTS